LTQVKPVVRRIDATPVANLSGKTAAPQRGFRGLVPGEQDYPQQPFRSIFDWRRDRTASGGRRGFPRRGAKTPRIDT
jgi:hypothetical protein